MKYSQNFKRLHKRIMNRGSAFPPSKLALSRIDNFRNSDMIDDKINIH